MVTGVAESWTNKGNKIWTFKLRKNAKWSDGKSVTAHDFVYVFQRLADPKTASPSASTLINMGYKNAEVIIKGELPVEELGVKALDDYTLQITLEKSIPYFLEIVGVPPLRKDLIEKYGNKWTAVKNLVVNGPYKLEELVLQEKTVLVKNPYYWNKDNIAIDKAITLVIQDNNIAYNRFLAGELDIVRVGAPKPLYEKAKKEYGDKILIFPKLFISYLGINIEKIPDVRVRKALQFRSRYYYR